MLAFLYGAPLNRIKNDKRWLVIFQVLQLLIILCTIVGLSQKIDVRVMYGLNVCFSLSTNLLNTLQMKIVPETLNNDEQVINKSIDIQYFTSNVLDIISNFIASILLGLLSYFALFQLSVPFFVAAIYFMLTIKLPKGQDKGKADTDLSEEAKSDKTHLFETLSAFKESRFASFIIMTESILSGGTDLLLTLAPIYLISEGISIKYIGLVLAVHKFSDLVGALLAPQVKLSYRNFFFLDYIVSGILLVLVFLIPVPLIKLILFALAFVIIGISGNMFEKMIYAEYDYSKIGLIYSANSSLYALFAVIFLIIPQFYTNIKMLGIVINVLT
ncbi:MFS transporter [Streptococcus dysgalactiae]|nr:MFS transporter [Streptococcus dysgalactiae]